MNLGQELQHVHAILAAGDVDGAFAKLKPIVAAHGNRSEVLHLLALAERARGDLRAAREALTRAVADGGGSAEMHNTLGNMLSDLGDLAGADREFEAAIARVPAYAPAWINRGRLASRRGDAEGAISLLERACALQPGSTLAYSSLAQAYREAGLLAKAEAAARKAVVLSPDQLNPRLVLGGVLRSADRALDAIAEYDLAERSGLRRPELLEARGGAWLDVQEFDKALSDYDRMTREFPAYLRGHEARARLMLEFQLPGDPFQSYRQLAEAHPGVPAVWAAWLQNLLSFRRFEEAADVASRAERAAGPHPLWTQGLAVSLSELGRLDEAQRRFEEAITGLGGDVGFLIPYARHLIKMKRPKESAAVAESAIALEPDNQLAWAYLGTAWRVLEDPRELWLHEYERHVAEVEAVPPGSDRSAADFARLVAPVLRKLHLTRAHPPDQSLRNGTQTPGALFDRREPEIRQIREAVTAAALAFSAALPDDASHPLLRRKGKGIRFTGSWSVRLTRAGFHINHVHNAGWLSSAYYFAVPEPAAGDDEHAGWLQLGAPPDDLGLALPPRRLIQPRVGTLVLFPSFTWHGTVPFATEGERLTAAFDIVPD